MPSASHFYKFPPVGEFAKMKPVDVHRQCLLYQYGQQAGFSLHRQAVQNPYGRYRPILQKFFEKVLVNRKVFDLFRIYNNSWG